MLLGFWSSEHPGTTSRGQCTHKTISCYNKPFWWHKMAPVYQWFVCTGQWLHRNHSYCTSGRHIVWKCLSTHHHRTGSLLNCNHGNMYLLTIERVICLLYVTVNMVYTNWVNRCWLINSSLKSCSRARINNNIQNINNLKIFIILIWLMIYCQKI